MFNTRFAYDLRGDYGDYWKKYCEDKIAEVKGYFESGKIVIDEKGVAKWNCGRCFDDTILEPLTYVTDKVDVEATRKVLAKETEKFFEEYCEYQRTHEPDAEEIYEMRAAFGEGETVVDVISGKRYTL